MSLKQDVYLDRNLRSIASSPNYTATLDSYLYNVKGISQVPNRVKFFIEMVDEKGLIKSYVLNERTANLVGGIYSYTTNKRIINGLILTVNPASVSLNMAKTINRTQTMTGWVEDHWGEELDTITFQGSTAAFIYDTAYPGSSAGYKPLTVQSPEQIREYFNNYMDIPDLASTEPRTTGPSFTGLTAGKRRESVSYQQWKKVIEIMNGNGATFDSWGFVSKRLFVQLSYDYASYRGYFESIDTTEDATSPYRFTYTVTFKAEKTNYSFLR